MIIKEIRAKNFMQYEELNIENIPQKGIIGIFGDNESGKSTIGEAISFALFGATTKASKGEKDKVISWNGAKSCSVEMLFEIDGHDYSIYRKIKRKGSPEVRLMDIKRNKILSVTARETDAKISRILGFGFKEFRYSTYVAQKELSLIQDKKPDRKGVIDKMLGILDLEEVRKNSGRTKRELNEKEPDVKRLYEEKVKEKVDLESKAERHAELTNGVNKLSEELKRRKEDFARIKTDFDNLTRYQKLNDEIKSNEKVKEEKRKNIETIKSRIEEIAENEKEIIRLEERLKQDEFVGIDENYKSKKENEKVLGRFKKDLEKIKDMHSSLKQHVNLEKTSCEEQLKGIVRDIQRADSDLSKIASISVNETEINELERRKKDAEANLKSNIIITVVLCVSTMMLSLLFHPVAMILTLLVLFFIYRAFSAYKHINDVKSEMENKRQEIHDFKFKKKSTEEIEAELESSKNEKRNLERSLGEKSKLYDIFDSLKFTTFQKISKSSKSLDVKKYPALKKLKELLSDVITKYSNLMLIDEPIDAFEEKLKREIEELNEKLMNKRAITDKIKVLKESIQSKGKLEDRKSKLFEEIKEIENKIIELKKKLPSIDYSDEKLKQAEIRKDELDEEIRRIEGNIKDFRGQLKSIEPDLKKLPKVKEELLELQKSIGELEQKIRIYRELESVVKETSGNIRKRLGPQIEAYFSWILPKITNNRYKKVRIDSDFNIQAFSEEKHDYVDLGVLSGGTSDQLLISLRLAFAKALTPASGQYSTQFLFLDEPLSSFDPNRRASFLEFLRSLETSFQQIFVISHLSGLENYMDNHIKIKLNLEMGSKVSYTWE